MPGKRCPQAPAPRRSARLYARVPAERSRLFRYLLEGYAHLACLTVVDRKAGLFKLTFSPQQAGDMRRALDAIGVSMPLTLVEPPLEGRIFEGGLTMDAFGGQRGVVPL